MSATDWVCLMYHDIGEADSGIRGGKEYFSVPAKAFEDQLDQLADLGLAACTIEHALDADGRRIAVSFDDGDHGQFTRGFPALARRGMTATFFITTNWVGRPGYVSWEALREMRAAGMSIQSHTRSHPFLSELGPDQLTHELRGSREELDERLEQHTVALALPGGDAPRAAYRGMMAEAGYSIVATSRWGVNRGTRPGAIAWVRRCTVRGCPTSADFRRVAEGDAWLAGRRGIREGALGALRSSLGPSRYARWRRRFLDAIGGTDER